MKTIGIILAAGQSKRFGASDKLLADFMGKPLCAYAAEAMKAADVDAYGVCLSNKNLQVIFDGFDVLECNGTQSDSLKTGVEFAQMHKADRLLVALGDMPFITCEVLNALLAQPSPTTACYTDTKTCMVPAVFDKSVFPELMQLRGDTGAKKVLANLQTLGKLRITDKQAFDVDRVQDLNTYKA